MELSLLKAAYNIHLWDKFSSVTESNYKSRCDSYKKV